MDITVLSYMKNDFGLWSGNVISLLLLKPQMSVSDSDGDGSSVGDGLADARLQT